MPNDMMSIEIDTYTGKAYPGTFHFEMRSNNGRFIKGSAPRQYRDVLKSSWRAEQGFAALTAQLHRVHTGS